jgi:hypothetical protein
MSNFISAGAEEGKVALTRLERERLSDSQLKIQSVAKALKEVDPKNLPGFSEIKNCLEDAGESMKQALRSS